MWSLERRRMGKARAQWLGSASTLRGRAHPARADAWRMGTLRFAHPTILASRLLFVGLLWYVPYFVVGLG